MRDRLIELLDIIIQPVEKTLGDIADYLLANGVFVPPCKVGDTVFRLVKEYNGEIRVVEGNVFEITITHEYGSKIEHRFYFWAKGEDLVRRNYSLWCSFAEIGKTVFLTREEAEQALKGGEEG